MAHDAPSSQKSTEWSRVDLPTPVKNREFGITPTLFCPPKPLRLGPLPHIRCGYTFLLYVLISFPALLQPDSSWHSFLEQNRRLLGPDAAQ